MRGLSIKEAKESSPAELFFVRKGSVKIYVTVKPHSRENRVEETAPNQFLVKVRASPREGKANQEVIESLARYFGVPKGRVALLTGLKSKHKILNIEV